MNEKAATDRPVPSAYEKRTISSAAEIAEEIETIAQARAVWLFEAICAEVIERRFRETGFLPPKSDEKPPQK